MYNKSSLINSIKCESEEERVERKLYAFVKKDVYDMGTKIIEESKSDDTKIMTLEENEEVKIRYDIMQGRPSVKVRIQGRYMHCLLDTGAKINVMSINIFRSLTDIELIKSEDVLKCANNSKMIIAGKANLEVEIGNNKKTVKFTVVEEMSPDLVGGIDMQRQFGYCLMKEIKDDDDEQWICNIDARFGRIIDDAEREQRSLKILMTKRDEKLEKVIKQHRGVFMADNWDVGCTMLAEHKILTKGEPINTKPWRQPMNLEEKIDTAIENLAKANIIRRCNSPWNTPLICVWKKDRKDVRLCLDFRKLNAVTERQAFPMPNVEEMLDNLYGAKYFSTIDLGNAYYQVPLEKDSQIKTAFSTKNGQYCFTRMPFGIAAAPGTFQELMTKVLDGLAGTMVYMDDIMVFSEELNQHYVTLGKVLERIQKAGLRVNPEKCNLLRKEVKFLGHVIDKEGIRTDSTKVAAIKNFEKPKCIKNLRSFLGICNYYRRFIKDYSKKSRALEKLCGSNCSKLVWSEECEKAFGDMKQALTQSPILGFPDIKKTFILDTDASFDAIGAVLSQQDDNGKERVIAYG